MCYKLIAKRIDKGSMAYLLNRRYSRIQIILTQFIVLVIKLSVLVCYATGLIIFISNIMFKGEMEIIKFLLVNLGLFILEVFYQHSVLCLLVYSMNLSFPLDLVQDWE